MHISFETIKKMADLGEISPEEIGEKLTFAGLELESIKKFEDDSILELAITPNRPDALSHMGIARELAAILGKRTTFSTPSVRELGASTHDVAQVVIEEKQACPRYACRVIDEVKIHESPKWLKKKLLSLSLKPINNIVDITNWVLHEYGQPLHAFDFEKLSKSHPNNARVSINIRKAIEGENLETLDGVTRKLCARDLVIADGEKALAIAGVMGGANSQVTHETQNILLESAYFEAKGIRKTAKRLQLSTDSSYRFERGTDPNGVLLALDQAACLIQEIAGGKIRREAIDVYPNPIFPKEVSLRPKKLAQISALPSSEIEPAKLRSLFLALGIETAGRAGHEALKFRVPTFRPDIKEEVDLIEEAMRLIGFDKVPTDISLHKSAEAKSIDTNLEKLENLARIHLSRAGFCEALNFSFGAKKELEPFSNQRLLSLKNPLGEEYSYLRQSLLPGLIKNLDANSRQNNPPCGLFEIGTVFLGKNTKGTKPTPTEINLVNLCPDAYAHEKSYLSGAISTLGFFELKAILECFFESLKVGAEFVALKKKTSYLHPAQSAEILVDREVIGSFGFLHPDIKSSENLLLFEIDLCLLKPHCFRTTYFKALPKYPGIQRDLAVLVDKELPAGELIQCAKGFKKLSKILRQTKIFDVYIGKGVPKDKKSIAFSLSLRDPNKTLKEEEIEPIISEFIKELHSKFDATLRT